MPGGARLHTCQRVAGRGAVPEVNLSSRQGGTIFNTSIILLFYNTYFTLYSGSPERINRIIPTHLQLLNSRPRSHHR